MTTPEELRALAESYDQWITGLDGAKYLREYAAILEASASVSVPEPLCRIDYKGDAQFGIWEEEANNLSAVGVFSRSVFEAHGKAQFAAGIAAGRGMAWQPIETAPKDGTCYWASDGETMWMENAPENHYPGEWTWNESRKQWRGHAHEDGRAAKFWMRLPPAPQTTQQGEVK
jgi:hypothetical protein